MITAYLIDGQPVGVVNQSWLKTQLNGNSPFKIEDDVSMGYEDISSITNWDRFGLTAGKDFKYVRKQIQIIDFVTGFENLSDQEKIIAVNWFSVPQSDALTIYTIDQLTIMGREFSKLTTESRQMRFLACISEVYNRLTKANANEIVDTITVNVLDYNYIKFGREGTVSGDPVGIYDYINSTTGTIYENTGLSVQNYTPVGMTLPELVARLMDILANGNY